MSQTRSWMFAILALLMSAFLTLSLTSIANAAPSEDDIRKAKENEAKGRTAVAQVEAELAQLSARANAAMQHAQEVGSALNKARDELDAAQAAARKYRSEAQAARSKVEAARQHLAQLATTAYRSGSSLQAASPYLQADGLNTIAMRQIAIELFGGQADKKMQTFQAVEQVATVMDRRAQEAEARAAAVEADVARRSAEAQVASQQAVAAVNSTKTERERLIAKLAELQGTTVRLVRERQEELERQRRAREEAAARARAARIAAQEAARRQAEEAARQQRLREQQNAAAVAPAPTQWVAPQRVPVSTGGRGGQVVAIAKQYLGIPYVWGGESTSGLDCSGLVKVTFARMGVSLPHYAASQYSYGQQVPLAQMQPGDLLFWGYGSVSSIFHVAIYVGGGMMIEAPHPGASVTITPVRYGGIMPYVSRI